MDLAEVIEALDGCKIVIEEMSEADNNPKYWAVLAALEKSIESLDALYNEAG